LHYFFLQHTNTTEAATTATAAATPMPIKANGGSFGGVLAAG